MSKVKLRSKRKFNEIKENSECIVDIGRKNVGNWNRLKKQFSFSHDTEFVEYLLSNIDNSTTEDTSHDLRAIITEAQDHEKIDPVYEIYGGNSSEKQPTEVNLHSDFSKSDSDETSYSQNVSSSGSEEKKIPVYKKVCRLCDGNHFEIDCPLHSPANFIGDSLTFDEWSSDDGYAVASLPGCLEMKDGGVYTKVRIPACTRLGPLVGTSVKEMEIPDDSNMTHIWQVTVGKYISTENENKSNWVRFLRAATSRAVRNLIAMFQEGVGVVLVTRRALERGEELLYWSEPEPAGLWATKNTNCGGCNLNFSDPMRYRIHCSVFHEASQSLNVKRYHCKVCGMAILGKQAIIEHAANKHGGRGAYRCQYCSKFFLRFNYLEMHRNYGCTSNPHRAPPLCNFCGRKFNQPQKLKVHIKRMHNDLPEVLAEYQCRVCSKVLGSRMSLQRHTRDVHDKTEVECPRCCKNFQNSSNLKLHMLTHSGDKPFKCLETGCTSVFPTKQSLQLHYKMNHGLAESDIPEIQRSIEYTLGANSEDSGPSSTNYSRTVEKGKEIAEKSIDKVPRGRKKAVASKGSRKWLGDPAEPSFGKDYKEGESCLHEDSSNDVSLHSSREATDPSQLIEAAIESAEKKSSRAPTIQ